MRHTGAYITDQEARNAYTEQMREKERLREHEKMDVGKLRNQYGRMRRLQQRAMLVFNADDFKDESYKVKNPPSVINHLFVDVHNVSAPPRARYRKPSNFPALKAPSKGIVNNFRLLICWILIDPVSAGVLPFLSFMLVI